MPDHINAGMKDFTIGGWVYGDKSFSSWSRIWDIGNGTNNYMFLSPKSGANTLRFAFKKDASSGEEIIEDGFSLYEWMGMHVIVTVKYDDNNIGYGKLYINGNLFGDNDNITVTPEMLGLTTSNYIAKSQFAGDPALGGKIDEFVICDYAMEYSEVETLYHNGLPANLFNVYSIFTYSDFSSITTDLDLFTSYDDVNVEWTSSDESVISTSGVVTRDKIQEKEVILTATMTYTDENNQTYSISKTIEASVLPLYDNQSLVARWVFENDDIKIENGNVLFTDISENSFEGRMVNDARIRTIGETDQFNVIDLGNGTGYFDMGTEIVKSLVQLSNYTIGAYFRIDNDYTEGNANGNFLWNFSNMNDANNPIGYLICKMVTTGVVITPNNWGSEQGPNMYSNAPKGAWHHICYVQNGNLGYLYLDGELMGYSRVNQTPANTLKRDGLEGTPYNWIGRSCYTGDVYLRKTLVYDFSLYDGAITEDRFFEDIRFGIDALNNAYNENPDYIDPSLIDEYNRLTLDGDLQNVVSDLTLPLLGEDPSVTISWESNSKYISSTGVVTRPESLDANVVLTATLKKGLNVMTKTFNLKVKASDPKFASDLLFRHDFLSSMISGQNVTESGEMNYVATLKNGAIIETLSDDSSNLKSVV